MNSDKRSLMALVFPLMLTSLACPTRTSVPTAGDPPLGGQDGASWAVDEGGGSGQDAAAGTTGAGSAAALDAAGLAGAGGAAGAIVTCNPACDSAAQTCVGTTCLLDDGERCSVASQCLSDLCTSFYPDLDGDGYGSGPAVGFCGTATPVGYVTQNGDCCDDPTNLTVSRLIHPGADFQTTSAGGVCNITWDYDCSGTIEKSQQDCSGCTSACQCLLTDFPDDDCGTQEEEPRCGRITNSSGLPTTTCIPLGGTFYELGCR